MREISELIKQQMALELQIRSQIHMETMTLMNQLQARREKLGMSVQDVADICNRTRGQILSGERHGRVSFQVIVAYANAVGYEVVIKEKQ